MGGELRVGLGGLGVWGVGGIETEKLLGDVPEINLVVLDPVQNGRCGRRLGGDGLVRSPTPRRRFRVVGREVRTVGCGFGSWPLASESVCSGGGCFAGHWWRRGVVIRSGMPRPDSGFSHLSHQRAHP